MKFASLVLTAQIATTFVACAPTSTEHDGQPTASNAHPVLAFQAIPDVAGHTPPTPLTLNAASAIAFAEAHQTEPPMRADADPPANAVDPAPLDREAELGPEPELCNPAIEECDGPIDSAPCAVEGAGCVNLGEQVGEACNVEPPSALACAARMPAEITVGEAFSCAIIDSEVRCWGADVADLNPEERTIYAVDLPGAIVEVSAGDLHACAATEVGEVYCWGGAEPAVMGAAIAGPAAVDVGMFVEQVAAGGDFTCVRSDAGVVKCWGDNVKGQLGQGHRRSLGDDPVDMGDALPVVDLGFAAVHLAAGQRHACALDGHGRIKCWGANDRGQLGLGDANHRGDQPGEMGARLPFVELSFPAIDIDIVGERTCVLGEKGEIACWSQSTPETLPATRTILSVGLPDVVTVSAGTPLCGIDDLGQTKCLQGAAPRPVDFGFPTRQMAAGQRHTCVLGDDKQVGCWGDNDAGQLGHADKVPGSMDAVAPIIW
jgi:hypothetical protein